MPKITEGDATYTLVLPREKMNRLKAQAALQGKSIREYLEALIDRDLGESGSDGKKKARK